MDLNRHGSSSPEFSKRPSQRRTRVTEEENRAIDQEKMHNANASLVHEAGKLMPCSEFVDK